MQAEDERERQADAVADEALHRVFEAARDVYGACPAAPALRSLGDMLGNDDVLRHYRFHE